MNDNLNYKYDTPESRWRGIGPYYAMFPTSFADRVIAEFSRKGDFVLDPFAGRGTSIFSAAEAGRVGVGIEIGPLGWVYGSTKLAPASKRSVKYRLHQLSKRSAYYTRSHKNLPLFFRRCFDPSVLAFLLAARSGLEWKSRPVDRTLMALLLVYLHGKEGSALSNQMHQAKSMSPQYCINWWRENKCNPPKLDLLEFMLHRIQWRYQAGIAKFDKCKMYLGDSANLIKQVSADKPFSLLFTSPPYLGITDYQYDQWLRHWLLGGSPNPHQASNHSQGKSKDAAAYSKLLQTVFQAASLKMQKSAVVYLRTSALAPTLTPTLDALRKAFPKKRLEVIDRPAKLANQTHLFLKKHKSMNEVDIIMT